MDLTTGDLNEVDGYISGFPGEVQKILQELRGVIRSTIPGAEEAISYGIPTFRQNGGYVVYFGGFQKHVSIYPAPVADPAFAADLAPFASGRGTAKFPLNKPLPVFLIQRIVKFNAEANSRRAAAKAKGSTSGRG